MGRQSSPIELLERQLRDRFKTATITLDRPQKASGIWFLDVMQDDHRIEIQWKPGNGFGVSSAASLHSYGEGADEIFPNEEATYGRVVSLLLSRSFTSPPEPVRLRELRKAQGLSQAELALLLNKQQGEISKIERRSDVLVSTLREYVQSIGAEMRIIVRMPDGPERALQFGDTTVSQATQSPATRR